MLIPKSPSHWDHIPNRRTDGFVCAPQASWLGRPTTQDILRERLRGARSWHVRASVCERHLVFDIKLHVDADAALTIHAASRSARRIFGRINKRSSLPGDSNPCCSLDDAQRLSTSTTRTILASGGVTPRASFEFQARTFRASSSRADSVRDPRVSEAPSKGHREGDTARLSSQGIGSRFLGASSRHSGALS